MTMYLKNTSNALIYAFPRKSGIVGGFDARVDTFDIRAETSVRLYAHGAAVTGDAKLNPKAISVEGMIRGTNQATLENELKNMKDECEKVSRLSRRLYLTQWPDEYYAPSVMQRWDCEFLHPTVAKVTFEFLCADPFRYYKDATIETHAGTAAGGNITVSAANAGTDTIGSPAIITATTTSTVSVDSFRLQNNVDTRTDGAPRFFNFAYELKQNEYVKVDASAGTVRCYGSARFNNAVGLDMIKYMTAGEFFEIKNGLNTMTYLISPATKGGVVPTMTIVVEFRKRWL